MKRFHELNKDQQKQAVEFAKGKIGELVIHGVIVSDEQMTQNDVNEVAEAAAEDAWYSEREDFIIEDIADGK